MLHKYSLNNNIVLPCPFIIRGPSCVSYTMYSVQCTPVNNVTQDVTIMSGHVTCLYNMTSSDTHCIVTLSHKDIVV